MKQFVLFAIKNAKVNILGILTAVIVLTAIKLKQASVQCSCVTVQL